MSELNEINQVYLNKTHIIFNAKWKQYITTALLIIDLNLKNNIDHATNLIDYYGFRQKLMRIYLEDNTEYDCEGKYLRNPEYYAFAICLITNIDDCENWIDVSKKMKLKDDNN